MSAAPALAAVGGGAATAGCATAGEKWPKNGRKTPGAAAAAAAENGGKRPAAGGASKSSAKGSPRSKSSPGGLTLLRLSLRVAGGRCSQSHAAGASVLIWSAPLMVYTGRSENDVSIHGYLREWLKKERQTTFGFRIKCCLMFLL